MIVDQKAIIFMTVGGAGAFSSTNETLIEYFSLYYDRVWNSAQVTKNPGERQSGQLPFSPAAPQRPIMKDAAVST